MSNGGKNRQTLARPGWILLVAGLLFAGAWLFLHIRFGDVRAPLNVVPAEWHAFLLITNKVPCIRLEMTVKVLKTSPGKPTLIPLFPGGTVFKNMQIDDSPAAPVKQGNWYFAEIQKAGRFVFTADIEVKPKYDAGTSILLLQKPEFIQSVLHADSEEALEVQVTGVTGRITGTTTNGTHGILQLGQQNHLAVTWREPRPPVERTGSPSVVPAVVWTVGEKFLSANALLAVDILGGPCDQMTFLLPRGADKLKLSGPAVRDFRMADDQLTIFLRERMTGRTDISVSFDVPRQAGDTVVCPSLNMENGRLDAGGWILVINDTPGILLESSTAGTQPVSDLDVPPPVLGQVKGKPLYLYKTTIRGAEPAFDVVTKTPFPIVDTIADRAEIQVVVQPGGEEITRIRYSIRNNGRQFLSMNLPAGSELLFAEVDHKACKVSKEKKTNLIPLAKSIQTLGGLIPFPVEIIYCRQTPAIQDRASHLVDLPELPDVPVAVAKVTVYHPNTFLLKEYHSKLSQTAPWKIQEDPGYGIGALAVTNLATSMSQSLAYNYYKAGYTAYQDNRLEEAEKYLTAVQKIVPSNSPVVSQSKDILGNIRAGRGEVSAKADKMERAKISTIQETLARDNDQLQVEQAKLIAGGLVNIRQGNEELGAELLKQADDIGGQLAQRSASTVRQKSVRREYDEKLRKVETERKKKQELQKKYSDLQQKAQTIAKEAGKKPESSRKGKALARGILSATSKWNLDVSSVQSPDAYSEANQPENDVTVGAQARQIRQKMAGKAGMAPAVQPQGENTLSLEAQNATLNAKVSALEEALSMAETKPNEADRELDSSEVRKARELIEKAGGKLDSIRSRINQKDSINTLQDIAAEKELSDLAGWVDVNRNTYGTLNDSLSNEFTTLTKNMEAAGRDIRKAREAREKAAYVTVPLKSGELESYGRRKALARFLSHNYLPEGKDGMQLFDVENDGLKVRNCDKNPEKLNAVMDKFVSNDGRVVPVAGRKINASLKNIPAMNSWFSGKTADGRRYAVLDEAQYRTLAQAAAAMSAGAGQETPRTEQRNTIVGTSNSFAEQAFKLVSAEADNNTIEIGGSDIILARGQYLALDCGNHVSVIKVGEVHGWQDEVQVLSMDVSESYRISMPETGTPVYFEKILLFSGESPDIEMVF